MTGNGAPARNRYHPYYSLQRQYTCLRKAPASLSLKKQQGPQPPYPPRGGGDEFIHSSCFILFEPSHEGIPSGMLEHLPYYYPPPPEVITLQN